MTDEEKVLSSDIAKMTDQQLIDRAACYNGELRRGRELQAAGEAIVSEHINLYVMCQNELYSRLRQKIERETDRGVQRDGV